MLRKDALDEREADYYEALYTQSQAQFGDFVQTGTVVNNYAHIFDLLIRLRQACHVPCIHKNAGCTYCLHVSLAVNLSSLCVELERKGCLLEMNFLPMEECGVPSCQAVDHPYLVVHSAAATAAAAAAADAEGSTLNASASSGMCGLCHDPLEQPTVANCGHTFCRVCDLTRSVGQHPDHLHLPAFPVLQLWCQQRCMDSGQAVLGRLGLPDATSLFVVCCHSCALVSTWTVALAQRRPAHAASGRCPWTYLLRLL